VWLSHVAESIVAYFNVARSIVAGSIGQYVFLRCTLLRRQFASGSIAVETTVARSVVADFIVAESFVADFIFAESIVACYIVANFIVAGSIVRGQMSWSPLFARSNLPGQLKLSQSLLSLLLQTPLL